MPHERSDAAAHIKLSMCGDAGGRALEEFDRLGLQLLSGVTSLLRHSVPLAIGTMPLERSFGL